MLTILVIFCMFLVLAFIAAALAGIISMSPFILLIICLPLLDYFMIKAIFGKKKKKKDE